jgi:UPF0755 protein
MSDRKSFRERVDARHRPKWSAVRFVVFVAALVVCSGAGYGVFSLMMQPGESLQTLSVVLNQPVDQWALNLYLRFRQRDIEARPNGSGNVAFSVQSGDTAATVGVRLQRAGLILDTDLFRYLSQARGVAARLEVGDYQLQYGMTMDEILATLQHGRKKTTTALLVEGWRLEEMAAAVEKQTNVKAAEFIAVAKTGPLYNFAFLKDRPVGSSLEGFLFPDTYEVPLDAKAEQIVVLMLTNFDNKVGTEFWARPLEQGLTPYRRLIVASIVEREAQKPEEQTIIASVYLNRVAKGMKLEADPTVQYAMGYQANKGVWWKTPVSLEEYNNANLPNKAYNTYLLLGLPPTPICSPGRGAIRAAFEPAKTEYLFFLGRGDGSHVFAKTFEEHQANIAKYQK